MSGSTYSTNIIVPGEGFKLISGTPKTKTVTADSGASPKNYLCGDCGTTLWRETATFGDAKVLKIGTLDDPNGLNNYKPAVELYTKHRVEWLPPIEGAEQKEGMP
ncbi:hypothetical protein EJ05DRAFT_475824 [Pseudovirgaria hyperparasitica]|uniref:CENP-V/GFA domain-containing protein n=1 Tax=Pseudovirgaria hyperparasitica TaxID=470096 RepID=A0A6A6W6M3_9PEZI|nr:uncharacterized protein EJ05DRAFT_475824 [Pseudovirgaria hyperparasitica]KAF2758522.1 hypothetical protein EJ05DRAFT_475824 [Pseudovirgaria hyperparasitica]